ncbi:oxidoreductase [Micromonospora sp. Llam0]|uniref:Gfo/Idh/MocA family protein n=1 Tax=Micromonospora sp. Llam0 TaxID=2485143 RepID=UPI000F47C8EB|nr:Gfo/Idh/MocA family oxidoreductase [Micromonospora sp. Llam0]ROO60540.1 oxidoreductase [Micromonospora sp. Llam0]
MTIRVAVAGLGWAGRELWLRLLGEHDAFEVVAAAEPDPRAREAATLETGVRTVPDVDALDPYDIDLAVVAVPNHLHAETAARLLRRGISVFLEKPVCLTLEEAAELAGAERAAGATLLAGSAARHRADVTALRRVVPTLGRIQHAELAWTRSRGIPRPGGWFTRLSMAGGGALVDLGWHLLDTLNSLIGPAESRQVVGVTSDDFVRAGGWNAAWRRDGDPADGCGDVEDTARGFLVRQDGVSVSLRTSWASHDERDVSMLRIEGSEGVACLRCTFGFSPNRLPESELTVTRVGATTLLPVPADPVGAEYRTQLDGLATSLADPGNRGTAIADARLTVGLIDRFYQSAHPVAG